MASGAWEHRGRRGLEPPSRTKASKMVSNERWVGGAPKSKKNKKTIQVVVGRYMYAEHPG
jgi:hypothetical protein